VKNILITGAAGFIGFNLSISFLKEKNLNIIGVDSLNDAYDNNFKKIRIRELEKNKKFSFLNLDLSNEDSFNVLSNNSIDTVFHLAARAGVRQSFREPKKYITDNTISTANLSNFIKNNKVEKLIIASTSSIYGDSGDTPMKEDRDEKYPPPSVYASSKLSGELMAKTILEGSDTCIQIPRFFTVYGPFGRPDMSILRFIHWVYTGSEILLYGDGNQKRSFTYIDDVVSALHKLYNSDVQGVFNIGSDKTESLNNVIKSIENNLNMDAKIDYQPRAFKDVDVVIPNLDKMRELNWNPEISISEGIKNTIEWYLNYKEEMKNIEFKFTYEK
jgi:nucleoside-diphosphate-sugar epimerase|tara:strand:- start:12971 stop:13960 length:990 start_codon:yes stop_codon:yes gene_type:complete